jgi:8-oxo-dGTP pyrophosphatase MutT (NUDIX family)
MHDPKLPEVGERAHDWRVTDRASVVDDKYAEFGRLTWEHADGRTYEGFFAEKRPSVIMVPVTKEGRLVLIKQFRHGARCEVIEVPGGLIENGQEPKQAATDEFNEETGYRFVDGSLTMLGTIIENPAQSHKKVFAFAATVERIEGIDAEPGVQVFELDFSELVGALSGRLDLGAPIEPVSHTALSSYVFSMATVTKTENSDTPECAI